MQDGWSALMAAVFKSFDDIALRLIQAGATPHIQDKVRFSTFSFQPLNTYLCSFSEQNECFDASC